MSRARAAHDRAAGRSPTTPTARHRLIGGGDVPVGDPVLLEDRDAASRMPESGFAATEDRVDA
jgi:hypothetical protein